MGRLAVCRNSRVLPLADFGGLSALAPAIYFGFAQWRAGNPLVQRFPYMAGANIFGAGIMLTVVGAVLRVIVSRKIVFERTPKYGIAQQSDSWDDKRYGLGVDAALGFELLLVCFSVGTAIYAAAMSSWSHLFYTSYFLVGLLFMIGTSLVQTSFPIVPRVQATSALGNREP